jgi:hypothetical protein
MKKIFLMIMLIIFTLSAFSQETLRKKETYYQQAFALLIGGETEMILKDRTRVDIVTETHAIEVDFAEKWAESIGQALHYEGMTGKKAGVLLVIKGREDERFLDRLMGVAAKHGIDVWVWDWTQDTWSKVDYKIEYIY